MWSRTQRWPALRPDSTLSTEYKRRRQRPAVRARTRPDGAGSVPKSKSGLRKETAQTRLADSSFPVALETLWASRRKSGQNRLQRNILRVEQHPSLLPDRNLVIDRRWLYRPFIEFEGCILSRNDFIGYGRPETRLPRLIFLTCSACNRPPQIPSEPRPPSTRSVRRPTLANKCGWHPRPSAKERDCRPVQL